MFTGIVKSIEQVIKLQSVRLAHQGEQVQRLQISRSNLMHLADPLKTQRFANLAIDDSVAINGTCLTIVALDEQSMSFDVLPETIRLTNLIQLTAGHFVNVEPALTMSDMMGGHQLQGHIDGLAQITQITKEQAALKINFSCAYELAKFNIHKGFVALDGISLTLTDVSETGFSVMIIPHTQQQTTAQYWHIGSQVNLEIDILSKTIYRYLSLFQKQLTQQSLVEK